MKLTKSVSPSLYDEKYFTEFCSGYKNFLKTKGRSLELRLGGIIKNIPDIKKGMKFLDIACGRGEMVQWAARKGAISYGIDYSKDAIALAKEAVSYLPAEIRKRINFKVMNAKKLNYPDRYFDRIIMIEMYEHLYPCEKLKVLKEARRVLKDGGCLLLHTEPNRLFHSLIYRFWSYPLSTLLIVINKIFTGNVYPIMLKLDRETLEKQRRLHVGEPTYFSIKRDIKKVGLSGIVESPNLIWSKPHLGWKDWVYNFIVYLDPLSKYFPLNLLFGQDFMVILKK